MKNALPRWVVALTGASGMAYGLRLLDFLSTHEFESHVIVSEAGLRVLQEEHEMKCSSSTICTETLLGEHRPNVYFHSPRDIGAAVASGSFLGEGMVIAPCSMATLGAIATGTPQNLIHRAADVVMKEGRRLILVPRETPLSAIHLENMLKLSRLGVRIIPAMPGFYNKPKSVEDLVDMMTMKILDNMGIENSLVQRWGEKKKRH